MHRSPNPDRPAVIRRPLRALLAALLVLPALPAAAELVILEDGRFLKASGYRVEGARMRVELLAGGALTLPLGRVSRVIDDEIEPPPPAPEPAAAAAAAAIVPVPWEFADGQAVPATPFGELIYAAAERHRVNPALVAALVRAESAFDPRAVSHKGAGGLMQLMPATARRFGLSDAERFEPERNLEAGTRYLRWLLDRFEGDVALALAAYNAGEGTIDRYGGVPPFRETRTYIRRIYSTLGVAGTATASLL
jgi:soluble lytic murein transglycosylase-like protein